jgi:hypothetical protein
MLTHVLSHLHPSAQRVTVPRWPAVWVLFGLSALAAAASARMDGTLAMAAAALAMTCPIGAHALLKRRTQGRPGGGA